MDNDVISGAAVDNVGMNVLVNFGDYRSNGFLIFEKLLSCRMNKHDQTYPNSAKHAFRLRFTQQTTIFSVEALVFDKTLKV